MGKQVSFLVAFERKNEEASSTDLDQTLLRTKGDSLAQRAFLEVFYRMTGTYDLSAAVALEPSSGVVVELALRIDDPASGLSKRDGMSASRPKEINTM